MKVVKLSWELHHLPNCNNPECREKDECDHIVPVVKSIQTLLNIVKLRLELFYPIFLVKMAVHLFHDLELSKVSLVSFCQK